ncbi:acetylcholine receptor subunit beta-like [Crassostrea angulata]|uniref:acetylcholine receptor subunit beta-like n=1 Tax=Magallana angulata TaxID=2784310 RepID=UPI0022B1F4EA|nr:acetylcholine receptor subunit beta-like [Crassostrea angulata]
MNLTLLHLFLFSKCFLSYVEGNTSTKVNNLISTLLNDYDKRTRPVKDQQSTLSIDVSFYLSIVNDVDEVAEKLVTTGYLYLTWTDQNLAWDSATNDINWIYLNQNGFTKFKEMGGSFYYVYVYNSGDVTWKPYEVFETRCAIDITYFPYDKQTCEIIFIVWSYSVDEVAIHKSSNGIDFYEYEENSVWTVLYTESTINKDKYESEIIFTIYLQRKPKYYLMNIILPVLCLGLLSLLVFLIPVDGGEKMGYSITVFLSFAVFLSIISSELPVNSESTSILSFYLVLQMVIGTLELVISAIQLRLHHRKKTADMSQIYIKIVKLEKGLRCKSWGSCSKKVRVSANNEIKKIEVSEVPDADHDTETRIEWSDVTSAIDFLSFCTIFVINISITLYLFIAIIDNKEN